MIYFDRVDSSNSHTCYTIGYELCGIESMVCKE